MELFGVVGGAAGSLLGYLIPFLIVLTVVVFIHELGHFLIGRWCGVGVNAFSIGFGPELVGFTDRHGTRWKLSAIPLGGYVKFAGDANGASVPDAASLSQMSPAERAVSFHHKTVLQRAAVVAAGPIANFLLAIAIFAGITYVNGRQILAPRVDVVQAGSAAERAGFKPGDLVLSINGRSISSFTDMQRIVSASADDELSIAIDRDGREMTLTAVPDLKETETPFGKQRIGLLGLQASRGPDDLKLVKYGLLELDPPRRDGDLVRHRADLHLYRAPRRRPRIGGPALGTDPHRAGVGPGRDPRRHRRPRQPRRRALGVDRPDQPVPDPAARWRAPFVLRNRGAARPPLERPGPGDRVPHRACHRRDADAVRDMERHRPSRGVVRRQRDVTQERDTKDTPRQNAEAAGVAGVCIGVDVL